MENAEKTELEVEGMTCSTCALSVQKYIEKIGGEEVHVNFATKEVRFNNPKQVPLTTLKKGIKDLGYEVVSGKSKKVGLSALEKKLIISAIFTLPLLMHMFLPFVPLLHDPIFQLLMSLPVMYFGISYFGISAYKSVKNGTANMDVLIFIGSISAFIYSIAGTIIYWNSPLIHNYMFYETAATIITLVLLGNWIEERSVAQTTTALNELLSMQKQKAKVLKINANKKEEWVDMEFDQLLLGDTVKVNSGDQVVADGVITEGYADIDESLITGESSPVFKEKDAPVISGSLVVDGSFRYKVKKAGKQSTLSAIIEMVKDAQSKKPKVQRVGDRISGIFVPVVVGISLLTFLLSYFVFDIDARAALMSSVAVLVISCPCAMGLATPTAIMVGVGRGAKNGILVKGGDTVEKLAKIKTVVFDKTGTLTTGKFKVIGFETYHYDETVAKNVVYHMEQASSHPIAKSIIEQYRDWNFMKFQYEDIKEYKGKGIYAKDASGNTFKLGTPAFAGEGTENLPDKDILLNYCGQIVAGFDIQDQTAPQVKETISGLHRMGIKTVLLSGDNEKKCNYLAQKVGIKEVFASQLPEQKLEKIRELSAQSLTAMVGDGINDAPALSRADVGISLGTATDIAKQSAEVMLISGNIYKVLEALQLGRKTYSTIKQNLFWALFYNVIAIPVAAVGLLSPMIAALSMAFSDVVVVGNSIRLKWRKLG